VSTPAEQFAAAVEKAQQTLAEISGSLSSLNAAPTSLVAPPVQQGVADQGTSTAGLTRRMLTMSDQYEIRSALRKKSTAELQAMFYEQAGQKGTGIPLDAWLSAGGSGRVSAFNGISGELDPMVAKALDSAGASALIRQDLEPILYELYIRVFPAFDRLPKEPANGLTHTFQQITSFGDAQFMGELGTVTDDRSVYVRQTTNIAILATRRGVSLKSQFAAVQSGAGFNPEQLELQGGLRAMAHRMQQQIFSGTSTNSGGTAANELGLFDANAFTGLRSILNTSRAVNVDPLTDPATTGSVRRAFNSAATQAMQEAGNITIIWANPLDKEKFDEQQDANVRYTQDLVNIAPGVNTNAVNTVFGATPLAVVPGDSIGAYVPDVLPQGWTTARDAYLLDESTITLPYLGSEGPTVLDIPIGISGQLTHLFIIFGMWGLAVKAPTFSNKVRFKVS
jgi:hypothetical protein